MDYYLWKLNAISHQFAGEFTLRAFLNGRLDLSQAENVGKLVSAKSMAAADAALAGIQVTSITFSLDSSWMIFCLNDYIDILHSSNVRHPISRLVHP